MNGLAKYLSERVKDVFGKNLKDCKILREDEDCCDADIKFHLKRVNPGIASQFMLGTKPQKDEIFRFEVETNGKGFLVRGQGTRHGMEVWSIYEGGANFIMACLNCPDKSVVF